MRTAQPRLNPAPTWRTPAQPESIGADLIHEARRIEREKVLIEIRKELMAEQVRVEKVRSYGYDDISAEVYRGRVLRRLDAMLDKEAT